MCDDDWNVDEPVKPKKRKTEKAGPALAAWEYPDPKVEAKFLFHIAPRNGGIESMRALIDVTPRQREELELLARTGQLPSYRVSKAISFRRDVLLAFDKLVVAWDGPAVADRRTRVRRSEQPRIGRTSVDAAGVI